jgi:hypothetical protein
LNRSRTVRINWNDSAFAQIAQSLFGFFKASRYYTDSQHADAPATVREVGDFFIRKQATFGMNLPKCGERDVLSGAFVSCHGGTWCMT